MPWGAAAAAAGDLCSNDHPRGDGFVGAGVDEHEGTGAAVAAVGVGDEREGFNGSK